MVIFYSYVSLPESMLIHLPTIKKKHVHLRFWLSLPPTVCWVPEKPSDKSQAMAAPFSAKRSGWQAQAALPEIGVTSPEFGD